MKPFAHRLAVLIAAVVALQSAPGARAQQPGGKPPPPPVTVETVKPETLPITFEYAGRVVASREVEVRARVAGILLDRSFEEGSSVAPNQTLFRIDSREFEAQVALAEAQLRQAQAQLQQAVRNEERARTLSARGAASTATLDDAISARELAEAQVAAADAQLTTARLSLTYATVNAPVGGISSLDQVPEGSLLSVNTLLTRISQLDPIYVNFSAADTEASAIRRFVNGEVEGRGVSDLSVEVSFGDGTVYEQKGTIDFTSSNIDASTGTILSRAVLPNPRNRLLPGQFVRVLISGLQLDDAIVIPTEALMQNPQSVFVYVLNGQDLAEVRPIETGREIDGRIVVSKGLAAGDRVIVKGVVKVRPNAPVTIAGAAPQDGTPPPAPGTAPVPPASPAPPPPVPAADAPASSPDAAQAAPASGKAPSEGSAENRP